VIALEQAPSIFYVLQTSSAEIGLHSDNQKFSTQHET